MDLKIKRALSVLLTALLLWGCFSASVSAVDAKAVLEFKVSDDGYAVVYDCATSAKGILSVPNKITIKNKSYNVKYIGDRAFDKCKSITQIKIPEGVTAIGSAAFRSCTALKEVYIPESLVRCEFDAFDGCKNVTVHCYMANYQFISLCGTYSSVEFDIIDYVEVPEGETSEEDDLAAFGFIGTFINALKQLIQNITEYFGVGDDDFSIDDLPFDLPFDIPVEDDSIFDIDF